MAIRIDGTNTAANPGITGTDADTGLQFGTDEVSIVTGGTDRVTVNNTGMGIGTTSPNAKLQINSGDIYIAARASSTETGIFFRNPTDTATYAKIGYTNTTGNLVLGTTNNYATVFVSNDTERMRILSGGGLTFNGDTATANALDDYEEGTWTPVCYLSHNPSGRTITDSGEGTGTYVKVGKMVLCEFYAKFTAISGSGGFNLGVNGLPYAADATVSAANGSARSGATGNSFICEGVSSNEINVLRKYNNGGPNVPDNFRGFIIYHVD
jgi:hypothetical protein